MLRSAQKALKFSVSFLYGVIRYSERMKNIGSGGETRTPDKVINSHPTMYFP